MDPELERKAQLEKEKQLKKKEVPMLRLKDGSLIPSHLQSSIQQPGGGKPGNSARRDFLQNL